MSMQDAQSGIWDKVSQIQENGGGSTSDFFCNGEDAHMDVTDAEHAISETPSDDRSDDNLGDKFEVTFTSDTPRKMQTTVVWMIMLSMMTSNSPLWLKSLRKSKSAFLHDSEQVHPDFPPQSTAARAESKHLATGVPSPEHSK